MTCSTSKGVYAKKDRNSGTVETPVEMRIFEDRVGIPSGMIRVVSCHHFDSQDVFLSDPEPVAFCTAQEKLLVATVQHSVEVRDLDCRGHILHSFPTVDRVKQMVYCDAGNYVATLERKSSRHSCPITYVRVYLNWWIDMKGQPMRVRIAGCVTPSSQSGGGQLEMVELPLDEMATCICCCRKTATLAICKGKNISVYSYNLKIHDISKQRFHDFDLLMNLTVSFPVQEMMLCEDYFACISNSEIQVFRVLFDVTQDFSSSAAENRPSLESDGKYGCDDDTDECSLNSCVELSFESYFEKNEVGENENKSTYPCLFPTEVKLPSIQKANTLAYMKPENLEICGPSVNIPGCHIDVKMNQKYETWEYISLAKVQVTNLLYRSFPGNGEYGLQALHLCPLYVSDDTKDHLVDPLSAAAAVSETHFLSNSPLHSSSYDKLKGLGCFFSGSQVGYLYDIKAETKLLCQYPYTAIMKSVAVEPDLIHVLTETGLETYTSRLCHRMISQIEKLDCTNICPSSEEAVCLLGLRPFLGVEQLCLSDGYLILISTTDDSISSTESIDSGSCTIYSLKMPSTQQLHCDLMEMGQYHQNSSPATYIHLLSEAHMILRNYMLLKGHDPIIRDLYMTSCAQMADHFLSCELALDRPLAIPYYNMSQLSIEDVVQRVTNLQSKLKNGTQIMKVLISYLDHKLLRSKQSSFIAQETAEIILDIYSEEAPDSLWEILLLSGISSYKLDKAIFLLKKRITSKKSTAADTLAIAVLLFRKRNKDAAQNMLLSLSKDELVSVLLPLQKLLCDKDGLSVVGQLIKQTRPDAFMEILLHFVQNDSLTIGNVIAILKMDSTEKMHDVPLLKEFLESFFSRRKYSAHLANEAVILLLTIYVKRLKDNTKLSTAQHQTTAFGLVKSSSLFGNRKFWLNAVPPFNGHGITRTCSLTEANTDVQQKDTMCPCWNCNEDLLRLQSLLCSDLISEEVLSYAQDFFEKTICPYQNVLRILCSEQKVAIQQLVDNYPAAVLPFAFDNFENEEQWCHLLSLLEKKLDDDKNYLVCQNFQGVLSHLSEILHPEKFTKLLAKQEICYIPFIKRCLEKHQANQLKDKIMSLGREIKAMM